MTPLSGSEGILGCVAVVGGVIYALVTASKLDGIKDEDFDSYEDEDGFLDFDEMYADDLDKELDEPSESTDADPIEFDKVNEDAVFASKPDEKKPAMNLQDEDADDLEESTVNGVRMKLVEDTPINIVDYDTEYFEMVCNVSRQDAIKLIMGKDDKYTEKELNDLPNSELADIYSAIIEG